MCQGFNHFSVFFCIIFVLAKLAINSMNMANTWSDTCQKDLGEKSNILQSIENKKIKNILQVTSSFPISLHPGS